MPENRLPSGDIYSDWHCAWQYALVEKPPAVKHMAACIFGENDGPDWIWIFQTEDNLWAYLVAGCDYTGWDCRSDGSWKGGFATSQDAIDALDTNIGNKKLLERQVRGESPYSLA